MHYANFSTTSTAVVFPIFTCSLREPQPSTTDHRASNDWNRLLRGCTLTSKLMLGLTTLVQCSFAFRPSTTTGWWRLERKYGTSLCKIACLQNECGRSVTTRT